MGVMFWVGTGLRGWQLLIPMFIAGLGGGFFIAPVTNVVLAGISSRDATAPCALALYGRPSAGVRSPVLRACARHAKRLSARASYPG